MQKNNKGLIGSILGVTYFSFFFIMLLTITASAYVDPATTAMLTQIVAGVFITAGVAFGIFRRKIIMFFKNISVKRMQHKIEKENNGNDK